MIDIIIDDISETLTPFSNLNMVSFQDKNDACMNTIVSSFTMGYIVRNGALRCSGLQVIFHLADLNEIQVNFIHNKPIDDFKIFNKDFILSKCAMESILRVLYNNGCITDTVYSFQARTEDFEIYFSPLYMNPNKKEGIMRFNGVIRATYAYLSEQKLTIFLGDHVKPSDENYKMIKQTLQARFKEKGFERALLQTQTAEDLSKAHKAYTPCLVAFERKQDKGFFGTLTDCFNLMNGNGSVEVEDEADSVKSGLSFT